VGGIVTAALGSKGSIRVGVLGAGTDEQVKQAS